MREGLIAKLAKENEYPYNILKACEEMTELQEVLLKRLLKSGTSKNPTEQSIIEEIGDVMIRLDILREMFGKNEVDKRIADKLSKYYQYTKDGKYNGHI